MKTNASSSDLPKLSAPAQRALASVGIMRLSDLSKFSEAGLLKLHGFGPSSIKPLKEAMTAAGIKFKEIRNEK